MSAAEADPVIAATAVSASKIFFILKSLSFSVDADRLQVRVHRIPEIHVRTIRGSAENAVAAAHTRRKTNSGKMPAKRANSGINRPRVPEIARKSPIYRNQTSSKSSLANSALSEMNAKRASALVPISRSTESAVPSRSSASSTTRSMRPLGRIHGGFLELRRHHLAEAFEAADLDLGVGVELALEQRILVGVVAGVDRLAAVGQP